MGRLCPYDLWFDTFEYEQKIDAWAFLKEAYGINHLVNVRSFVPFYQIRGIHRGVVFRHALVKISGCIPCNSILTGFRLLGAPQKNINISQNPQNGDTNSCYCVIVSTYYTYKICLYCHSKHHVLVLFTLASVLSNFVVGTKIT